jgi:HemX protein
MFTERWMFDFALYAYLLSLVFSYATLLTANRQARILSSSLLIVVWLTLTVDAVLRFVDQGYGQVDPLILYTWALTSVSVVITLVFRFDLFVFCAGVIGITVLSIHLLVAEPMKPAGVLTDLVFVHITLAISSYALFSLSGLCATLYLLSCRLLKRKQWNLLLRRLPSLDRLEQFMLGFVGIGVFLLFISLVLGSLWSYHVYGHLPWTDIKVIYSLLLFLLYAILLLLAWRRWIATKKIAWGLLLAMVLVISNYVLSKLGVSFHYWGM